MTESREPRGPQLTVTQMRGAERRGLYRVLLVSMLLAIVVIVGAWLTIGSQARVSPTHVGPGSAQPASSP
jgi:hypothetical protein